MGWWVMGFAVVVLVLSLVRRRRARPLRPKLEMTDTHYLKRRV